jgi:hypothetical protein
VTGNADYVTLATIFSLHRRERRWMDAEDTVVIHDGRQPFSSEACGIWVVPRRHFARRLLRPFQHESWEPLLRQVKLDLCRCTCIGPHGDRVTSLDTLLSFVLVRRQPRLVLALVTQACLADAFRDLATQAFRGGYHVGEPRGGGTHTVQLYPDGRVRVHKELRTFTVTPRGDDTTTGTVVINLDADADDLVSPVIVQIQSQRHPEPEGGGP